MNSWITICDTCKREGWVPESATDGDRLADLIEPLASGNVRTRRHSCLMGCTHGCNITVQARGKSATRSAGSSRRPRPPTPSSPGPGSTPTAPTGQVPYRTWPEPVKGHFVTRHLPLPDPE